MLPMLVRGKQPSYLRARKTKHCTGLFAPRAGQSFRDEQRRRRSQYDRGTRLAEIEDAFDNGSRGYRYHPNAFHAGSPYGFSGGFNTSYYPGLPGLGSPV